MFIAEIALNIDEQLMNLIIFQKNYLERDLNWNLFNLSAQLLAKLVRDGWNFELKCGNPLNCLDGSSSYEVLTFVFFPVELKKKLWKDRKSLFENVIGLLLIMKKKI